MAFYKLYLSEYKSHGMTQKTGIKKGGWLEEIREKGKNEEKRDEGFKMEEGEDHGLVL